jgi:hypothetical protein
MVLKWQTKRLWRGGGVQNNRIRQTPDFQGAGVSVETLNDNEVTEMFVKFVKGAKSKIVATAIIVLVGIVSTIAISNIDTVWKVFDTNISSYTYNRLQAKYAGFYRMDIDQVIHLLAKTTKERKGYFLIEKNTEWRNNSYREQVLVYPEIELTDDKKALYCFAVYNSHSPEEIFVIGFFVDENNCVMEEIRTALIW